MWTGRHVVLGESGGIASYKSCYLVRRLTEAPFEALTGRPVLDRVEAALV